MIVQAALPAEDGSLVGNYMLGPPFSMPAIEIKEEQPSPPAGPVVNKESENDALITRLLDSILNGEGDLEMADLDFGSDIGNELISTEDAEPTGKQVTTSYNNTQEDKFLHNYNPFIQSWSNMNSNALQILHEPEDHGNPYMNVFNWDEHSFVGVSDILSPQLAVDENNCVNYVRVSEDPAGTEDGDIFATGIRVRPRTSQVPPQWLNQNSQGTANRRLRFQRRLQIGPVSCTAQSVKHSCDEAEELSSKSVVTEVRRF